MHNFTGINYTLLKLLVHFPVLHYFSIKESRLKWRPSEETVTMENKKGNVNFLASGLRQDVSQCSPSSCKSTVLGTTASFLGRRPCSCTGNPAHKRAFTRGLMLWCCHIKILNRLSLILALVSGVRWDSGACARPWSPGVPPPFPISRKSSQSPASPPHLMTTATSVPDRGLGMGAGRGRIWYMTHPCAKHRAGSWRPA